MEARGLAAVRPRLVSVRRGNRPSMALHMQVSRTDDEYRSLLEVVLAAEGVYADPVLRQELVDTGFVRRDAQRRVRLHLTPEGRRFLGRG